MILPEVPVTTYHYRPDRQVPTIERTEISQIHVEAMEYAFALAKESLEEGNPPVGAVLIDNESGDSWAAKTTDYSNPDILGHAELRSYSNAKKVIGRDMSGCTLVTTAQPCSTCTPPYAEGEIKRVVYAAPRPLVFAAINTMRPRLHNMPDLLFDGKTDTLVTEGLMASRSLELFLQHARNIGRTEEDITETLNSLPRPYSHHARFILNRFVLTRDGTFKHIFDAEQEEASEPSLAS